MKKLTWQRVMEEAIWDSGQWVDLIGSLRGVEVVRGDEQWVIQDRVSIESWVSADATKATTADQGGVLLDGLVLRTGGDEAGKLCPQAGPGHLVRRHIDAAR